LAAKLAFGADFKRHTGDLARESAQLVHHGIDGLLQCSNLAFGLDLNLLGQIPVRHGCGDLRNRTDLIGETVAHAVHL